MGTRKIWNTTIARERLVKVVSNCEEKQRKNITKAL